LQEVRIKRFTLEGSFTSTTFKALLASSTTLWITCEEFLQSTFWLTLTVIFAGRNAMLLMSQFPSPLLPVFAVRFEA
jgi:hypothetical protein